MKTSSNVRISKAASYSEYINYVSIPSAYRPRNLEFDTNVMSYDYVAGVPATMSQAHMHLNEAYWKGFTYAYACNVRPWEYVAYMKSIGFICPTILGVIESSSFTPVCMCHGDATPWHVIEGYNGIVTIIDPGNPRGLECKELDESKLLFGYDNVGQLMFGANYPRDTVIPFEVTDIHRALLATHYYRMTRHHKRLTTFSFGRIMEIHNEIGTNRCNTCRWQSNSVTQQSTPSTSGRRYSSRVCD